MRRLACGALLALLASGTICPEEAESPWLFAETQLEMHMLASEEAKRADDELRRVERGLIPHLDEEQLRALEEADRAFAAYRAAEATFVASEFHGGSLEPTEACLVHAGLTIERTRSMKAFLETLRER